MVFVSYKPPELTSIASPINADIKMIDEIPNITTVHFFPLIKPYAAVR